MSFPSVSVVIPTIGRPSLRHAVASAVTQTVRPLEIIVAADTNSELPLDKQYPVPIRVLRVGPRAGGNAARMAAITAAAGDLIALLDDDDTWSPRKLQEQLSRIPPVDDWVLATRVHDTDGDIRPIRLPEDSERIDDYLFRMRRLRNGTGKLHTSSLLFPRSLASKVPFDPSLKFHQDTAWLVALSHRPVPPTFAVVEEALVTCEPSENSVSRSIQTSQSIDWARAHMADSSARVRGDFILTVSLSYAIANESLRQQLSTIQRSFQYGRPGVPAVGNAILRVARAQLTQSKQHEGRN